MQQFHCLLINGAHYLKLRDVALAPADSDHAFALSGENRTVSITTSEAYEEIGTEFSAPVKDITPAKSSWAYTLDGEPITMDSFSIAGYHFCKLSDLSRYLGFSMGYHQPDNALYLISVELPETDEDEKSEIPEQYTKTQTVVFEKLGLPILVLMNNEETDFCLSFNAFGADQLVYGTIDGETVTVAYDETGFFTKDAPVILGGINTDAWQVLA